MLILIIYECEHGGEKTMHGVFSTTLYIYFKSNSKYYKRLMQNKNPTIGSEYKKGKTYAQVLRKDKFDVSNLLTGLPDPQTPYTSISKHCCESL